MKPSGMVNYFDSRCQQHIIISVALTTGEGQWRVTIILYRLRYLFLTSTLSPALFIFVLAFVTCAICLCHLPLPLSSTLSPALFVFAGLGSVSMLNVSLSSESFFSFEICQLPCLPQFTTFLRRVCI